MDTNRQPPQLLRLFSDMLAVLPPVQAELLERGSGGNVLSFQYPTGADATMLVSKNAGRYRLQSDCFEAMGLVLAELCRRLEGYYKEAEDRGPVPPEGPFQVSFKESLPMQVRCGILGGGWLWPMWPIGGGLILCSPWAGAGGVQGMV